MATQGSNHDRFARATAKRAHKTSAEALTTAQKALELAQMTHNLIHLRPRQFVGRCALCGNPCRPRARYCHEHDWAA